jgi:hypothetical protein
VNERERRLFVAGMLVLFSGLGLLSHGCARVVAGGGHVFGAERVEGRIVEILERPSTRPGARRNARVHEAEVEFRTAEGRTIRLWDRTGRIGGGRAVGESVDVYYDPREPEKALLDGTAPFTVTPYLFELVAGWLVFPVGAFLLFKTIQIPKAKRT